jgi:hypothetical protein
MRRYSHHVMRMAEVPLLRAVFPDRVGSTIIHFRLQMLRASLPENPMSARKYTIFSWGCAKVISGERSFGSRTYLRNVERF